MLLLLKTFFDIALWRKGPQDLPASRALAAIVLLAYAIIEFIGVRLFDLPLPMAAAVICIDVLMISAWLWGVLAFFGRRQRFVQTITATLGVGILILFVDILIRGAQMTLGLDDALANNWWFVRFVILAAVMGRIFMHALEKGLLTGIALTIAIVYSTQGVVQVTLDTLAKSG